MKGNACLDGPKETELADILARFRGLNIELESIANRAGYLRGRLEGPAQCSEECNGNPERDGLVGGFRDALDAYKATLEGLLKDVSRLEEIA